MKKYSQKVKDYIQENYKGVGPKEMAKRLNEMFGADYTARQITSYYGNHKLDSGLTGQYEKGHAPHNKGKKGYCAPGSKKGWFKEGHSPHNHKPIGSEIIDGDGVTFLDGNRQNLSIANLACISKADNARLNQHKLRSTDPSLTQTGILIARLKTKIGKNINRKDTRL